MTFAVLLLTLAQAEVIPAPAPAFVDTGRVVEFPGGTVELHSPLTFADRDDVDFAGNSTLLRYVGPPTKGVIQFAGMTRARVHDLKIQIEGPGVTAFVLVTNLPTPSPTGRVSTECRFTDIWLDDGGKQHPPLYGFDVDSMAMGGQDRNNDIHIFERCRVMHYNRAAFHFNGRQIHQVTLDACRMLNVHTATNQASGVWCEFGGSVSARNCTAWSNAIDFEMGRNPTSLSITGFQSEHSKRLFDHGTTGAKGQVSFRDVRWEGEPVRGGKPVLSIYGLGPIVLESLTLNGINGVAPTILADCGWDRAPNGRIVKKSGTLIAKGVLIQQWHGGVWARPGSTFRVPTTWQFVGDGLVFGRVLADGGQPDERLTPERY